MRRLLCKKLKILLLVLSTSANLLCAAPTWQKAQLKNGQLRGDGELFKRISIGSLKGGSPEFNFPIYLEHNISRYHYGEFPFFSHWTVPQLTSYAVPMSGGIVWIAPGGEEFLFKAKDPIWKVHKVKPSKINAEWAAVTSSSKENPDRITIISDDGWSYVYDKGVLQYLEAPSKRKLFFKMDGSKVLSIYQQGQNFKLELLSATYDELGRLESLKVSGDTVKFTYMQDSEIMSEFTPLNELFKSLKFEYQDGLISRIAYSNGKKEDFVWNLDTDNYQSPNNLFIDHTRITRFLAADSDYIYDYGFDKNGLNLVKTNVLEGKDKVIYNANDMKLTSVDKMGVSRSLRWGKSKSSDMTSQLSEVTAADGTALVKLVYDESARISEMRKRGEMPLYYTYDDQDRVVEIKRGNYPPTRYEYKANMLKPSKITNSEGHSKSFTYDDAGQLTAYKDEAGSNTFFVYDELGRLIRKNMPMGIWQVWTYDSLGRIVASETSTGKSEKFEYNSSNKISKAEINGLLTWKYLYDDMGRLSEIFQNDKSWLKIERDFKDGLEVVASTNSKGAQTQRAFDTEGNLVRETNPLSESINFKYDPLNRLEGWSDNEENFVKFKYNPEGQIVFQENSEMQTVEREYDEFGRFLENKRPESTEQVSYDKFGRIIERRFSDNEVVKIEYDDYSRISKIFENDISMEIAYDSLDRVIARRVTYPNKNTSTTTIKYTPFNYREKVKTKYNTAEGNSQTTEISYKYDELKRISETYLNGSLQAKYTYDTKTQLLTRKTMGSKAYINFSYDPFMRLLSLENFDADGKAVHGASYDWDLDGNLLSKKVW